MTELADNHCGGDNKGKSYVLKDTVLMQMG